MNVLKKLLLAFFALALFGGIWAPAVYADDHEEAEPVVEEAPEEEPVEEAMEVAEFEYDPFPAMVAMRDSEAILVRMGGILDSYDGNGHPEDCDDFALYSLLTLLLSSAFEIEALFAPAEWVDIMLLANEATVEAFEANEAIFYLCQNGGNDSISAHNLAAGREGIANGLEKLRSAIIAAAERAGVDPDDVESSIAVLLDELDQELSAEDIEFLEEITGLSWDPELFYEDLLISNALLKNMGGWLDRLIAGETVGCGEYVNYIDLLLTPIPFFSVPDVWEPLFNEHIAIINSVLDSNRDLLLVCINGGNISEFMVFQARDGVGKAQDRLHTLRQQTEERTGLGPY